MITMEALQSAIKQRIDTYNTNDHPLNTRAVAIYDLIDSRNHILAEDIVSPFDVQTKSIGDGWLCDRSR
jgi:molybdopterin molybdotransferase